MYFALGIRSHVEGPKEHESMRKGYTQAPNRHMQGLGGFIKGIVASQGGLGRSTNAKENADE